MKVAIIKPPNIGSLSRGIGYYTSHLYASLQDIPGCELSLRDLSWNPNAYRGFDLVHFPYFDLFSLTCPIQINCKVVITIHDVIPLLFPNHYPLGKKAKAVLPLQKIVARYAHAIITDSLASKNDLLCELGICEEKLFVTYLAADKIYKKITDMTWLKSVREKYRLPEKFVLYVGGVNWNKNLETLARACLQCKIAFVVVGKEAVNEKIDLTHIENKPFALFLEIAQDHPEIYRLGFVPDNELAALYSLASVYVQPSFYEGFGLPLLEAMQCGCQVICAKNSSLVEIGGDAVVYSEVSNPSALALTISKTLNLPMTVKRKQVQLQYNQAKKFNWDKTAGETMKIYEKVLEQ